MKTNCRLSFNIVFAIFILSVFTWSCDKEVDPKLLPVLTTTEVIKMTEATAYSGGNITSDAGSDVTSRGVCWSETPNPTIEDKKTIDAAGTGVFESRIVGLNPATTYYIRAYAANKKGVAYGLQVTFKTKSLNITTTPITATTISSAVSGGTLETDGDSLNVTERGICWNTSSNPTIENSKIGNGKGKGKYSASITQLQIATQYYVRAYAKNETGTFYGDELSFITTNGTMTLTTTAATSTTAISATVGGSVPNDGGATVTERGFCISKLPNPTITNKIVNGSGVGAFASNITGLEANTTYYVRVFASNSVGTAYGNEISFTTKDGIVALTTTTATSITATSATSGGTITNDGGAAITARGLCWSTSANPTIANSKSTNAGTTGSFATNLTGLSIGTTYFLRAYATNAVGTSYGNEISFTTQDGKINLSTSNVTNITAYTAISGGNIISDGGVAVTARGVCWSTNHNPTTYDNKSTNGSGIGAYNSAIAGLDIGLTYYLRAYATNNAGTFYGNEVSFKTLDGTVILETINPTVITSLSAKSGGNVLSDEGVSVNESGVCWSKSENPTINNNYIKSTILNNFSVKLTDLEPNTNYYVRAYAKNVAGIFYGNQFNFATPNTVTDIDGNIYKTVIIGTQTWMAENLSTTKFNDGTLIPLISEINQWIETTTSAYCWYNNDETMKQKKYGAIYNGYTVISAKLAPEGWHIPSSDEWSTLINYLGGKTLAGGKLKETGTINWSNSNVGATDEVGFSALPGGEISKMTSSNFGNWSFGDVNLNGTWWCNNSSAGLSKQFYLSNTSASCGVSSTYSNKALNNGFSVRCVKD